MSLNEQYIEQIDDYLLNKLSRADKEALEAALSGDLALQQELAFQKDIQLAVCESRKMALKSRLQNIHPEAGATPANNVQLWAAGVAALVLMSLWFFWPQTVADAPEQTAAVVNDEQNSVLADKPVQTESKVGKQEITREQGTEVVFSEAQAESVKKTTPSSSGKTTRIAKNDASKTSTGSEVPLIPEMNEPEQVAGFELNNDLKMPRAEVTAYDNKKKESAVQILTEDADNFGYRYYDEKLFLYGRFLKSYELIEMNKKGRKKLYLYYDGSFYEIESEKLEITELKKIDDFKLIQELNHVAEIKELN